MLGFFTVWRRFIGVEVPAGFPAPGHKTRYKLAPARQKQLEASCCRLGVCSACASEAEP